ncbi:hypothetical protein DUNSADRAFT_15022 [Dunaliella salina]|uniref:Encoded protein n=1 Tax=Dunaliella salina TaxID=3046 RepID=A0ABQ7G672_DUNSA|nr:hypothetical protein DUNSADRAFT_15022 [Dunaliella salina]|eukprot:KAF5830105.1 hypothetical protein DUNSADRAFT_15022 [Dunaliella salina]
MLHWLLDCGISPADALSLPAGTSSNFTAGGDAPVVVVHLKRHGKTESALELTRKRNLVRIQICADTLFTVLDTRQIPRSRMGLIVLKFQKKIV